MKRIVLFILFFGSIVWGWHTIGERVVLMEKQMTEQSMKSEARQYIDPMIFVLTEANRMVDVLVQTINSLPSYFVRRHRSGNANWENVPELFKSTQKLIFNHLFKSYHKLSQRCSAQQREVGYYFYALRKMII